ncbi:MAG: 3'-to-5' exoribonuclease RNase R [uncultured Sulfurovum sp.]|uniref:exoribonuclease II n=1 Tax=uncultured Sulfurovum sp. TaxID=269237 RepID=A0A6S6T032_9BACT|nr:MAG: 3'-to-5' exoribonuclease RNase R [uncultured Sulfurovum sp.]
MSPFAIQLINGFKETDLELEDKNSFQALQQLGAIEELEGLWKLKSLFRVGQLYVNKEGRGFVEAQTKEQKDLLVEAQDMGEANPGDDVVVKRIIARRGRASAKVQLIVRKAHVFQIVYTNRNASDIFEILDLKTGLSTHAKMEGMDLKAFKLGTVLKVDSQTEEVLEVFGDLSDPKIDEKISLALYKRANEFDEDCKTQALEVEQEVTRSEHPNRVDLTYLDFCTIDPVTAKDFDDAIYFDMETYTLYVAIADVSHYVDYFSPIDTEAKRRGFTTYFPHKSFPMLPRQLSENICSLKPQVDRLAFVAKIELNKESLLPMKEEFFEAIIHSKRRFNYDEIDVIIETDGAKIEKEHEKRILDYLLPLQKITARLRKKRLGDGFDFRSEEIKLSIDANHELKDTSIETGTASHSLIEECMLLANQASAKRFEYGIFRIHTPPQLAKLETLLEELASIGLFVKEYEDSPSLIRAIQKEADSMNIASEVDSMIIKSLKQASYSANNEGHFGLGFSHYSHFTSPIRRYSDLILHRLIKAQLKEDEEQNEYLLRNIEPLCQRVSELERESTKAEWDFRDRKLARWAQKHIGEEFKAHIVEVGENAKAILETDIEGVTVNLHGDNVMLFDKIIVRIDTVSIAMAKIQAEFVAKREKEIMEL